MTSDEVTSEEEGGKRGRSGDRDRSKKMKTGWR